MTAVAAAAVVIPGGGVARAAPPVFVDPPTRVYTSPGVDLPFAGDDPITQQSKKIDVTFNGPTDNTCDVIDQDEHSGNCAFAQIRILEAGRGAMTIDDSGIAYTSGTQSGDNTFNIAGTFADIKSALESLVYVPPDDEFETADITPVTLEVSVQAPQPVPDAAAVQVDIRVEGANDPPNLTAPGDDPYQVNINETFSVAESAGTEVFEVTDEDAQQQDNLPPDYLLGVAWLDCGTMTFVKPNQSPGLVAYEGTVEDMLAQLAADYQAIAADPSIVIGQIGQNVSIGTGWANVVAVGWLASIDADNDDFTDNFNEILSAIDFHAPAMPATCTLTISSVTSATTACRCWVRCPTSRSTSIPWCSTSSTPMLRPRTRSRRRRRTRSRRHRPIRSRRRRRTRSRRRRRTRSRRHRPIRSRRHRPIRSRRPPTTPPVDHGVTWPSRPSSRWHAAMSRARSRRRST